MDFIPLDNEEPVKSFEKKRSDESSVGWPWKGHKLGGIAIVQARAVEGYELAYAGAKRQHQTC